VTSAPIVDRRGLAAALFAFLLWGLFPLYWALLKRVPALEIISHRVVWCGLFVVAYLLWRDGSGWLRASLRGRRVLPTLMLSSVLISVNWGLYIWAVTHGRVVDASLGYFINPLVNVMIGVLLLGERLNRAQWLAVAIAALGVLWLTVQLGAPPWIAELARFEWARLDLFDAPDAAPVALDALRAVAPEDWARLRFTPVPALATFAVLLRLRRRVTRPGTVFAAYLVLAGTARFLVEVVRVNPRGPLGLTEGQWISLVLVAGAAAWLVRGARRRDPAR